MRQIDVLDALKTLVDARVLPPYTGAKIHNALNSKRKFFLPGWLDIFLEPSMGAMWVYLWRLERDGLITSDWFDQPGMRKYRRRHYWLTDAGMAALK